MKLKINFNKVNLLVDKLQKTPFCKLFSPLDKIN